MSGRHDKSVDLDYSTNHLMTGPIVIRGLGRGMKDAFRSTRSRRHRAPVAGETPVVVSASIDRMLVAGPSVSEMGPSSPIRPHDAVTPPNGEQRSPASLPVEPIFPETVDHDGESEQPVEQHHTDDASTPDDIDPTDSNPDAGAQTGAEGEIPTDGTDQSADAEASDGPEDGPESIDGTTSTDAEPDAHFDVAEEQHDVQEPEETQESADEPQESEGPQGFESDQEAVGAGSESTPEPEVGFDGTSETASEQRPSSEAEPDAASESEPEPEPDAAPDSEAEPTGDAELTEEPAPGEASDQSEPVDETEPLGESESFDHAEPVGEPESVDDPASVEDSAPAEAGVSNDESGAIEWFEPAEEHAPDEEPEPESAAEPEATADPESIVESDVEPETESAAEPEPTEQEADPVVTSESPDADSESLAEPDPVVEPEPDPVVGSHPEVIAEAHDDPTAESGRTDADPAPAQPAVLPAPAVSVNRARSTSAAQSRPPRRRAMSERIGREAVGIVVLVVLALVCAGLIAAVVYKTQRDAAVAAAEAANYTPPPLSTPTPEPTGPVVAVIGDDAVTDAASGVSADARWTALLEQATGGRVSSVASADMGYAAKDASGRTFVQAAAKVPSNADVVVLFGGAADSGVSALSVAKAVTDAISAATQQAPDAKIVVVGPAFSAGVSAGDLTSIRNSERNAASIAKATWVDPISDKWLSSTARSVKSASALTTADEKAIATKMEAVVKKAVG